MNIENMALNLFVSFIFIVSIAAAAMAIKSFRQIGDGKVNYFSSLLFAFAVYILGYYLELNCRSLDIIMFVRSIEYSGAVLIPTLGILYTCQLTGIKAKKAFKYSLFIISLTLWIFFMTNPMHLLFYKSIEIFVGEYSQLKTVKGPLYYFVISYYVFSLIFSSLILIKAYKTNAKINKKSNIAFVLTTYQLAWFPIIFFLIGLDKYINPVPWTIIFMCAVFLVNEVRNNILGMDIKRWESIFFGIKEPVFLVSIDSEILCSNKMADILIIGREEMSCSIITEMDNSISSGEPMLFTINNENRWFDVKKNDFQAKNKFYNYLLIDITERRLIEEELRENKKFFEVLLEFMPTPVFYKDINGKYMGFNRAFEDFFGKTKDDLLGKSVFDINPYEFAKIYHTKDAELFEKQAIQTYETQVKDASGFLHEVIFHKATIINLAGEPTGLIGTILDITERIRAEAALKESEEKYRLIFEYTPIGVVHFSIEGIITDCNDNFIKIIGSSREVLIGLGVIGLPDKKIVEAFKGAQQGNITMYEDDYSSVTADKVTAIRIVFAPIRTEKQGVQGVIGIVEDISERRKLETALSNEKKLLETTLISVGDGVISTDNDGNIVFLNKAAEFLTGWTQCSAEKRTFEEVFNAVNEATGEKPENIVKKVLENGSMFESANHTLLVSKDGIERSIEHSAAPIVQENGKIIGVVLVFRDVSDKKQKQERIEFLSYHDQLTGLYNRRFYEEELSRLDIKRNLPLTIVMGDVNGLKLINDSFGHSTGDELIRKVAEVITRGCRSDDIIARLGGDEFVILLPKTDADEAENIIKRIRHLALKEKVESIDISVSFGYETKNNEEEDIQGIWKKAEDYMYKKKLFESPSMRGKTINTIISTLHEKNKSEEDHAHRVSELCKYMGAAIGLSEHRIEVLRMVGLLHDIGKIAIDENILNKPDKLTVDEWKEIKRHSEIGYRILSTVNDMSEMADYVLYHHERWDGKGYPKGLKAEAIPLEARIISIVEAYDSMASDRSYRRALSNEAILEELRKNAGTQFDPELVNIFIEKILRLNMLI